MSTKMRLSLRVKLLLLHPIWCYSIPQIFKAVQKDWDDPVATSARGILDFMCKDGSTACEVTFKAKGKPFLLMDCRVRLPGEAVRFSLDPDSGYVRDHSKEEWLTTAEEVFDALSPLLPNASIERPQKPQEGRLT